MKKKVQVKEQVTKSPTNIEQSLLENFVMLQKVVVKNSESVKELSEKVDKMITMIEDAAKNLAEKEFPTEKSEEKSSDKNDFSDNGPYTQSMMTKSKPLPRTSTSDL